MTIIIPSDFADEVERRCGSYDDEQARAVLETLLAHPSGRSLMAHALLPHFLTYLEQEHTAAARDPFSGARIAVWFPLEVQGQKVEA